MSGTRPAANRMTLQVFKARKAGASKGFGLLKKKRDALKATFQQMLQEIVDTKKAVGEGMQECALSFAEASYVAGGFGASVIARTKRPSVTCRLMANNVAGVSLPIFKMERDQSLEIGLDTLGITSGGQAIQNCRKRHITMMDLLIKMASLQTSFITLDEEIKMTSRRVNALEYVIIPKLEDVIAYINQEMDEQAREDFFRVKKVVEKKKQKLERERMQALADEQAKALRTGCGMESKVEHNSNYSKKKKNKDVIF